MNLSHHNCDDPPRPRLPEQPPQTRPSLTPTTLPPSAPTLPPLRPPPSLARAVSYCVALHPLPFF